MRLRVVFSEKGGNILAAAPLDSRGPVRARPMANERAGQRATDVEVPPEYADYDVLAVCQRLRVSVSKGKVPELRPKE
jgi:hypothetical protein